MKANYVDWKQHFEDELSRIKIPPIGYTIYALEDRVGELIVKLSRGKDEDQDANFNKRDIESTFRLSLELCITKMKDKKNIDLTDFTVSYRKIGDDDLVYISLANRTIKPKRFLSDYYSKILSRELVNKH